MEQDPISVALEGAGLWLGVNHEKIKEEFIKHLRESAFPEQFKGVVRGMEPPRDRDFRIIKKFVSVDPSKRGNTYAPCNLCGDHPKFKNDGMLIIDELGWLYLIGPVCGRKHYEGRFIDEEKRFDRKEAERIASDYLINIIPDLPDWRCFAEKLKPFAMAVSYAHAELQKTPSILRELRRAFKQQDGWLRVDEARRVRQANGNVLVEYHPINLVKIAGEAALRPKCEVHISLDKAIRVLSGFGYNGDDALSYIAIVERDKHLPELAKELKDTLKIIVSAYRDICSFRSFFEEENYRAIRQWTSDSRNSKKFGVSYIGNIRSFVPLRFKEKYQINITDLFQPLPQVPVTGTFETLQLVR